MLPRARFLLTTATLAAVVSVSAVPAQAATAKRYRDVVFSSLKITKDVTYGSAAGKSGAPQALKLDLYEPKGDSVKKRPVVVWVHGGGFAAGSKSSGPAPALAKLFARKGYVTASIDYRLLSTGCSGANGVTPECYAAAIEAIHDSQAAVRFLRSKAKGLRLDPSRIAIGGESAGAIASVGVGVLSADPGTSGNPGFSSAVSGFVSISGGVPNGLFVDRKTAPGLFFHGTADNVVPYAWSVQTRDAMRKNDVKAILRTQQGAGHVPFAQYRALMERESSAFLFSVLRASSAQGARGS